MKQIQGPLNVLFVGDSHGNWRFFSQVLNRARDVGAHLVIQLGDFGFWPPERDSKGRPYPDPDWSFAYSVDLRAKEYGIAVWAIRGNHDYRVEADSYPGTLDLTPGLHHPRDGERVELGGLTTLITGGAVSVDYHHRVEGVSWWADEITSDEDVQKSIQGGEVDIWLTHDSVFIPPTKNKLSFGELIDKRILAQNARMKKIFDSVKPKYHIHGHWHTKYVSHNHYGFTYGLSCESENALLLVRLDKGLEIL